MADIPVTPANAQQRLSQAQAGDNFVFTAGIYSNRLQLVGRHGTAANPISLIAQPGAVFDGNVTAEAHRIEANKLAKQVLDGEIAGYPKGSYPGLYPWMANGQLVIRNCTFIRLVDLVIRQSWPTLIALIDSACIEISGAMLTDGTFAIGALGKSTSHITIRNCHWTQDVVPHRMWKEIDWRQIHGDPVEDGPVDVANDWRLFDGDFFRGGTIRGHVRILGCEVRAAFNAIHLFNEANDDNLARDVEVANCTFFEIRDNILEAENNAHNWWFHHNEIVNGHKWISIEQKRTGFFYLFANRGWFDSIQGPKGDTHAGGGIFKTPKDVKSATGDHYVFHNSFYIRCDYLRNWIVARLTHQNNAIRFVRKDDPVYDDDATIFGDISKPPSVLDKRFTTDWKKHAISMQNDLIAHPTWPDVVRQAGYAIEPAAGNDPMFRNPFEGCLKLADGSPGRGTAVALDIKLIDGSTWKVPAGGDIGAWQGDQLFAGPNFASTPQIS